MSPFSALSSNHRALRGFMTFLATVVTGIARAFPTSLPLPDRPQVQYQHVYHKAGKKRGEKWRLFFEEPERVPTVNRPFQPTVSSSSIRPKPAAPIPVLPKPAAPTFGSPPVSAAPILLVLP